MRAIPFPPAKPGLDRRSLLKWITIAWAGYAGALSLSGLSVLRFFFPNVTFEPPQRFKVGFPGEYPPNQVAEQWKARYGVWIVRGEAEIYCLIAVCTHLGCTPNWLESERKFKCPCHGSGYYISGINFEGPAPRPLERAWIGLADDGQILVDKSIRFRYELEQWEKPGAFLDVA